MQSLAGCQWQTESLEVPVCHRILLLEWILEPRDGERVEVAGEPGRKFAVPCVLGIERRILTHTLVNAGHPERGQVFAAQAAERLLVDAPHQPETFAVYGALVLRGAVAGAHAGKRTDAEAMLDAADHAARHVGDGGNLRWTGFDATNVLLHRLNVALAFADPGRALAVAGKVDLTSVKLAERKASLHLDVARANSLCHRWDAALAALQAAEHVAPQELRTRAPAKQLVMQVAARAPRTIRSEAVDLARRCGIVL